MLALGRTGLFMSGCFEGRLVHQPLLKPDWASNKKAAFSLPQQPIER